MTSTPEQAQEQQRWHDWVFDNQVRLAEVAAEMQEHDRIYKAGLKAQRPKRFKRQPWYNRPPYKG